MLADQGRSGVKASYAEVLADPWMRIASYRKEYRLGLSMREQYCAIILATALTLS